MLLLMGGGSVAQAQQPMANHPMAFDVVSIREVKEQSDELLMNSRFIGDTFLAKNASLLELIALAYETRADLVFNLPGWARTTKWDVEAKISDQNAGVLQNLSPAQRDAMVAAMLTERFGVQAHRGSKVMPVFKLVIAPGGEKLKVSEIQTDTSDARYKGIQAGGVRLDDRGRITTYSTPVSVFATALSRLLEKTVMDETGLTKRYDLQLRWTPDELKVPVPAAGSPGGADVPGLSTAIEEQLGLKLRAAKAPIEVMVADKVSRPTSN